MIGDVAEATVGDVAGGVFGTPGTLIAAFRAAHRTSARDRTYDRA